MKSKKIISNFFYKPVEYGKPNCIPNMISPQEEVDVANGMYFSEHLCQMRLRMIFSIFRIV